MNNFDSEIKIKSLIKNNDSGQYLTAINGGSSYFAGLISLTSTNKDSLLWELSYLDFDELYGGYLYHISTNNYVVGINPDPEKPNFNSLVLQVQNNPSNVLNFAMQKAESHNKFYLLDGGNINPANRRYLTAVTYGFSSVGVSKEPLGSGLSDLWTIIPQ